MTITLEEGREAVRLARDALESHVLGRPIPTNEWKGPFKEERGVFVTLNLAEERPDRLRGCIGFPYPVMKLGDAIRQATAAAASEDPRFPPVAGPELGHIVVEVSVLTLPAEVKPKSRKDLPSLVRIGVDGLIISRGGYSGLLLPQVATEFGMDQTEFLSQACMKAGLLPDAWLDQGTAVSVFQCEVFEETSPRGSIEKVGMREP